MGFNDFIAFGKSRVSGMRGMLLLLLVATGFGTTAWSPSTPSVESEDVTSEGTSFDVLGNWPQNQSPKMPDALQLADEVVPMDAFGVREQFDRELVVNAYRHGSTMLYMKRVARWFPMIEPILEEHGIPDDFKYLAVIESGLDQVVSPAGAAGFWQFMKGTAPQFGLRVSSEVDERYHVEKSTHAACAYLLEAREAFGSWALAAASYNMGMAGVERELEEQGVDSYWELHLNAETARYVYRLLAIKTIFEAPQQYGFDLRHEVLYAPYAVNEHWVKESIPDLPLFASNHGSNLKELKTLNPWLRKDRLNLEQGDSLRIILPIK